LFGEGRVGRGAGSIEAFGEGGDGDGLAAVVAEGDAELVLIDPVDGVLEEFEAEVAGVVP
jgi:hypothetical protein